MNEKNFREKLVQLGLAKSNTEVIADVIFNIIVFILIGWAFVSFFSLTWGQALLISWMFETLIAAIKND